MGMDQNVIGLLRSGERPASGKAPGGRFVTPGRADAGGAEGDGRGSGAIGAMAGTGPTDGYAIDTDHLEHWLVAMPAFDRSVQAAETVDRLSGPVNRGTPQVCLAAGLRPLWVGARVRPAGCRVRGRRGDLTVHVLSGDASVPACDCAG